MPISNVVELRKVVTEQETASLKDVAKAISIKLQLADQNENDAANHRKEAGEMLVTLRNRVETDNQSWKQFVYDYFDRPRSELEKLMAHVSATKVVKAGFEAKPELASKTDREVARELGVSQPTVSAFRRQSVDKNLSTEERASMPKRTGKDGKQYKASKPPSSKNPTQQPSSTLIEQAMRIVAKMTAAQRRAFIIKVKETYK